MFAGLWYCPAMYRRVRSLWCSLIVAHPTVVLEGLTRAILGKRMVPKDHSRWLHHSTSLFSFEVQAGSAYNNCPSQLIRDVSRSVPQWPLLGPLGTLAAFSQDSSKLRTRRLRSKGYISVGPIHERHGAVGEKGLALLWHLSSEGATSNCPSDHVFQYDPDD